MRDHLSWHIATHFCCALPAGEPCAPEHSTCDGRNELCVGRGPGWPDHFASNEIIGRRQFDKALELWNDTSAISGACWLWPPLARVAGCRHATATGRTSHARRAFHTRTNPVALPAAPVPW